MTDIFLVFLALKWAGIVDMSWSIVFIPVWLGLIKYAGTAIIMWLIGVVMED